jgi:hypothetical protein
LQAEELAVDGSYYQTLTSALQTSTNTNSALTLLNIPYSVSQNLTLTYYIQARITGTSQSLGANFQRSIYLLVDGAGGIASHAEISTDLASAPFASNTGALVNGGVYGTIVGAPTNQIQVQCKGVATAQVWSTEATLAAGLVSNGGFYYYLATGGTDSGVGGGPTGSTSPQTVGGLTYRYLGSSVTVIWTLTDWTLRIG